MRSIDNALLVLTATAMLVADVYCVFSIGLFEGLAARNPGIGLLKTIVKILILPIVWFGAAYQLYWRSLVLELVILWFILTLVNHLVFFLNSRARLHRYFRTLALRPFGEKPPLMESDWSPINWDAGAVGTTER
jgi:hypothetical protein